MALIDSNNFITHLVWSGLVDEATCGELKEAIELCTVKDIYTKADMIAMLDKIRGRVELEKLGYPPSADYYKAIMKVLELIDRYKSESEDT